MAETVKSQHVAAAIAAIEGDMSAILQLLRRLSSEGYEALPEGLGVIEGMVFATSLRLSELATGIVQYMDSHDALTSASRRAIAAIEGRDGEIRHMVSLARDCISLVRSAPKDAERWSMLNDVLGLIERRAGFGAPVAPTPPSNVVAFGPRPVQPSPEGGAA